MDYVREELLRQNRALEALMRTGAEEPEESKTEETVRQRFGEENGHGERRSASAEMLGAEYRLRSGRLREPLGRRESPVWAEPAEEDVVISGERSGFDFRRMESVREVSRAIERDARRYDGGFTMY